MPMIFSDAQVRQYQGYVVCVRVCLFMTTLADQPREDATG